MKLNRIVVIHLSFLAAVSLPAAARAGACYKTVMGQRGEFVREILPISRVELHREPVRSDARALKADTRPYIDKKTHDALIAKAKQPLKSGEFGPRLISDEIGEVPDIDKAVPINHPLGRKLFLGLSGQQYFLVDSIDDLARGGLRRPQKIVLLNEHGIPYGQEVDPKTGKPIPYADNSSAWDAAGVMAEDESGNKVFKIIAGAMANDSNGKPLLITQKNAPMTRRRMVFHKTEFKETTPGSRIWELYASEPQSPFFKMIPRDGRWSVFDSDGTPLFIHSYGGGPDKLMNGDLYTRPGGGVVWHGDGVFENRRVVGAKPGEWKIVPYRSGMYEAVLDPTLKKVIEPPHIVLDVFKDDGSVWADAARPGVGPLMEGGHVEVRVSESLNGPSRVVRSSEDLTDIRRRGLQEFFVMVGSQGKYARDYGSFQAISKNGKDWKLVTKDGNELYDITEDFRVLTYATGRPVIQYGESGQEYICFHADERTDYTGNLGDLSRQIWMAPVKRTVVGGEEIIEIMDNTGLINEMRKFKPRPLKEKMK